MSVCSFFLCLYHHLLTTMLYILLFPPLGIYCVTLTVGDGHQHSTFT